MDKFYEIQGGVNKQIKRRNSVHTDPTAAASSSINVPFAARSILSLALISWVGVVVLDAFFCVDEDFFLERSDAEVELQNLFDS